MQYIFAIAISITFLIINYKIIYSDLKNKIIPNKYLIKLLLLIPLVYLYYFLYDKLDIYNIILQIILSTIISFFIYYYGVWSAGDAKYLLILSLFLPNIGILIMIGNLGIITIFYLVVFFMFFYFYKFARDKKYRRKLYIDLKREFKQRRLEYKESNNKINNYKIIAEYIFGFLTIFISIRLIKIYLIDKNLVSYNLNYNIYFMIFGIILFTIILLLIKIIIEKLINKLSIEKNIEKNKIKKKLKIILFLLIILFGIIEYIINKISIISDLKYILTIILLYYTIFNIIKYGYKLAFYANELNLIKIDELKLGDIVDKSYLIEYFGKHKGLGFCEENEPIDYKEKQNKLFLYPNPETIIRKIENPIGEKDFNLIKDIYRNIKIWNKENGNKNKKEEYNIVVVKTFAFAIYIFIGFITTFIFKNEIIIFLTNKIEKIKGVS